MQQNNTNADYIGDKTAPPPQPTVLAASWFSQWFSYAYYINATPSYHICALHTTLPNVVRFLVTVTETMWRFGAAHAIA